MRKIKAICVKELIYYFKSPMAYIILFLTISIFNIFFYVIIDTGKEATLTDIFRIMEFIFLFIIPLLTMRVFSEEKQHGTMEFLMTTPTRPMSIVLGKYFGVLGFYSVIVFITLGYYFILRAFSSIAFLEVMIGYCGVYLEGAMFIAIGVFVSSLSRNQILSAFVTYFGIFFLYFLSTFEQYAEGFLLESIRYVSCLSHAQNFSVGVVMLEDIVYYLSGIVLFIISTRLVMDHRS